MLQISKVDLLAKVEEIKTSVKALIIGLNEHIAYAAKVAEITATYYTDGAIYGFNEAVALFQWIDAKGTTKPAAGEVVVGKIDFKTYVLCTYDETTKKWTDINAPAPQEPVEGEEPVVLPDLEVFYYKHLEHEQI